MKLDTNSRETIEEKEHKIDSYSIEFAYRLHLSPMPLLWILFGRFEKKSPINLFPVDWPFDTPTRVRTNNWMIRFYLRFWTLKVPLRSASNIFLWFSCLFRTKKTSFFFFSKIWLQTERKVNCISHKHLYTDERTVYSASFSFGTILHERHMKVTNWIDNRIITLISNSQQTNMAQILKK